MTGGPCRACGFLVAAYWHWWLNGWLCDSCSSGDGLHSEHVVARCILLRRVVVLTTEAAGFAVDVTRTTDLGHLALRVCPVDE